MSQENLNTVDPELAALIDRAEATQHTFRGGTHIERLKAVLQQYERKAADAIANVRRFRDGLTVELRALAICLEATLAACTHAEKNARLRGFLELVSATARRIAEQSIDFGWENWSLDAPLVHDGLLSRMREENRRLQDRVLELESWKLNNCGEKTMTEAASQPVTP
jgi:hypothetical protein